MTMDRTKFVWEVPVQREDGETSTAQVSAYWSPDHVLTKESVAMGAAIQAGQADERGRKFQAVGMPVLGPARVVSAGTHPAGCFFGGPDGETFWFTVNTCPLPHEHGDLEPLVGTARGAADALEHLRAAGLWTPMYRPQG